MGVLEVETAWARNERLARIRRRLDAGSQLGLERELSSIEETTRRLGRRVREGDPTATTTGEVALAPGLFAGVDEWIVCRHTERRVVWDSSRWRWLARLRSWWALKTTGETGE